MRLGKALLALAVGAAFCVTQPAGTAVAEHHEPGDGDLHPVAATTVLDTRNGAPVGPGQSVDVRVTGRAGVPATDVLAVALDVTARDGTAPTTVTAYPAGAARPDTTTLHAAAGETAGAAVVVPVAADGRVTLANAAGSVHLAVAVTGWYGTATAPRGLRFHAFAPQPVLDTRVDGDGYEQPLATGATRFTLPTWLTPGWRPHAVLLRVTVPRPPAATRLTVYPGGAARPEAATLYAPAGRVSSTVVAVPVSETDWGTFDVWNAAGPTPLVVHAVGWATQRAAGDDGRYRPLPVATRVGDTRNGTNVPAGALGSGGTATFQVGGRGGVPHGATAALVTVSAVRPSGSGALIAYPAGGERPAAEQVGYAAARPGSSLVVAKLGPGGRLTVRASAGPVHVTVDAHGWYDGAADYVPVPSGGTPGGVVVDAAARYAYLTNPVEHRVEVLDLASGSLLQPIPVGAGAAGLDLTPDGRLLYVVNPARRDISVVDVATRRELRRIPVPGIDHQPRRIAIGAHGVAVVYAESGHYDTDVLLLRLADDLVYQQVHPTTYYDGALAVSRDREYVAIGHSGVQPGTLYAYETATGTVRAAAERLGDGTARVAVSSDGTLLVGGPYLVDRVTGEVRALPEKHGGRCPGAAFSPDDTVVYQVCGGALRAYGTRQIDEREAVPYVVPVETGDRGDDATTGVAVGTPDGSRVLVIGNGGVALVPVRAP